MKILIVSGFLGAGKTTFIQALSTQTGREFAVLENEYAAAGIDGERLESGGTENQVNVWEMTEGCICCSAKGDFAASVLTIANAVDPEYLVVEPTGVGKLSQIMENLRQIEYERITLLEPVTVVDIHSVNRYLGEYPELYRDQIAGAGTVIVSKTEQCLPEEKQQAERILRQMNPRARLVLDHYSGMGREDWEALLELRKKASGSPADGRNPEEEGRAPGEVSTEPEALPESLSLTDVSVSSPEALLLLLEEAIRGRFGNLLRAKGQLMAGSVPLQFDLADGRYSVTGTETVDRGKAAFIGTGLDRQGIRNRLRLERVRIGRPGSLRPAVSVDEQTGRPAGTRKNRIPNWGAAVKDD